jgi:iron(III) transport system ATP-binding protein
VAVRPEAWLIRSTDDPGPGAGALSGRIVKSAYLGSFQELTVVTELGEIFATTTEVRAQWQPQQAVHLGLDSQGVAVLPRT